MPRLASTGQKLYGQKAATHTKSAARGATWQLDLHVAKVVRSSCSPSCTRISIFSLSLCRPPCSLIFPHFFLLLLLSPTLSSLVSLCESLCWRTVYYLVLPHFSSFCTFLLYYRTVSLILCADRTGCSRTYKHRHSQRYTHIQTHSPTTCGPAGPLGHPVCGLCWAISNFGTFATKYNEIM